MEALGGGARELSIPCFGFLCYTTSKSILSESLLSIPCFGFEERRGLRDVFVEEVFQFHVLDSLATHIGCANL